MGNPDESVFIDQWREVKSFRPFPEAPDLDRMHIAHDLAAISKVNLSKKPSELPMTSTS